MGANREMQSNAIIRGEAWPCWLWILTLQYKEQRIGNGTIWLLLVLKMEEILGNKV